MYGMDIVYRTCKDGVIAKAGSAPAKKGQTTKQRGNAMSSAKMAIRVHLRKITECTHFLYEAITNPHSLYALSMQYTHSCAPVRGGAR